MNSKLLFVGTAVAIFGFLDAKAANNIAVEPEPVDYLRVCDGYGSGFFFIPGTETCIRLNGSVSSTLRFSLNESVDLVSWLQRARLNLDTRNETEYGTLRALYRLEGGRSNVDENIDMDAALISLAGFRAGFAGATYWSTNHGFGFVNAETISSGAVGAIFTDGYYGFDDATIFDYTWAGGGFSATIGVEDPRISYALSDGAGGFTGGLGNATNAGGTDGRANFYAGFNYSGDGFGVAFTAVHDSIAVDQNDGDIGGWAYKVSATLDLSDFIPGDGIQGFYLNDGDYDTDYLHTGQTTFNPEEIWGIAFNADLNDEVQFWANYWDVEGTAITAGGPAALAFPLHGDLSTTGDLRQFGVGLNWFPSAAPGFSIKAAFYSGEIENAVSPFFGFNVGPMVIAATDVNAEFDGFEITFRRDF